MKKTTFNPIFSASLIVCAALMFTTGCVKPPRPRHGVDLFDPEVAAQLVKEPLIIPGRMLFLEVTAEGLQVVPGVQKIVSLRNDISVPLVGEVNCAGLTLPQLSEKLTEAYSTLYHNPSVTLAFAPNPDDSPWGTVGVYGCVVREGHVNLPPTGRMTLTRAIQGANGLTPVANRKRLQVTRVASPSDFPQLETTLRQTQEFSYDDISSGRIPDPPLVRDDVVRVLEIKF